MHIRILSKFSLLVFLFSLFANIQVYADFQKSPNDHREYLTFELENRMRVLVISDPETDDAAASLAIQIGGGDDPENRAGMAHYLEHMLFLGTEKYPELDSYRTFIEQNGGATNAYTAIDLTNYNFSIEPDSLKPALDRFAQFFVAPLFPAEQVGRERGVVHAEFEMRTQRDVVRHWAAMRHAYNPKHPSSKFVTGTEKTLEGDVRPDLIEFFNENYSANLMNLVVLGREPVDELQKWVVEIFSVIKDSDADVLEITEPLFADGSLPALLKVRTLKNNPSLTLTFPVPDLEPYWRESPDGYISNLLGHEGKGSLLSELKAEGWADGLYVSPGNPGINSYTMTVKISLTESGHQNWENVTAYVFQYIREIRARGIDEWRFNEQKNSERNRISLQ
jgi:secreted Zn-dependent insulinase-like peptidase